MRQGGHGFVFRLAHRAYGVGLGVAASSVLLRTAMNFPPAQPSWALFGAQHIRMLEPINGRIPLITPIVPASIAPSQSFPPAQSAIAQI